MSILIDNLLKTKRAFIDMLQEWQGGALLIKSIPLGGALIKVP